METLTPSHPRLFFCRGMSYAFDGGVGSRYSSGSHLTPVSPRASFPTTFEQDGASSRAAVHQQSRPDALASTVIDPVLAPSQTTLSSFRGRDEIAFYNPLHQPTTADSSAMLDTRQHQPHQSPYASPQGSPQVLSIRTLPQVGPNGGLPSVRQLERVAELGEAAIASTSLADNARRSPEDEASLTSKRRRVGDSPMSPVVGQSSRNMSAMNPTSERDLLPSTSPRSRSHHLLSSPSSAATSRRSSEQRLSQLPSPWTGADTHRNRDNRAQTMPSTVRLHSSSQTTPCLPAHPLEPSHLRSLTLPSITSMHLRQEPYPLNQPPQSSYASPLYRQPPLASNPPARTALPPPNQLPSPSSPLPPMQLSPSYYQEATYPSQHPISSYPPALHAAQPLHYLPNPQTLPPDGHTLVWPPQAQGHLAYHHPYPKSYGHHLHYEPQGQGYPETHTPRRRRGNLPKEATGALKEWFLKNESNPYPTEEQKSYLVGLTGLSHSQVNNWFINARRRIPRSGNGSNQQRASTGSIPVADHADPEQGPRRGSHRPTLTEGVVEQQQQGEPLSQDEVYNDVMDEFPDPSRGQMAGRDAEEAFPESGYLRGSRSPPTLDERVNDEYQI